MSPGHGVAQEQNHRCSNKSSPELRRTFISALVPDRILAPEPRDAPSDGPTFGQTKGHIHEDRSRHPGVGDSSMKVAAQLSTKERSRFDRDGCRSFLSALASICRIRSRVTSKSCP